MKINYPSRELGGEASVIQKRRVSVNENWRMMKNLSVSAARSQITKAAPEAGVARPKLRRRSSTAQLTSLSGRTVYTWVVPERMDAACFSPARFVYVPPGGLIAGMRAQPVLWTVPLAQLNEALHYTRLLVSKLLPTPLRRYISLYLSSIF